MRQGGIWKFNNPTIQLTHTWLPTDKLVFVNQVTHVQGGFFLDNHDYTNPACGSSTYQRSLDGTATTDPTCDYNIQLLNNNTTGYQSRDGAGGASYQSARPSWEVKTDDNYFLPHVLGGDHALKFGVGWRRNPVQSFTHFGGGAQASVQCNNNDATQCGPTGADGANNTFIPAGSAGPGLVPLQADLFLDNLTNHNWWTWNSYIQDSYTTHRLTVSGGVRQDYQNSDFLGGCLQANPILPALLPKNCEAAASPNHTFDEFSPRVSATFDLTGHGTTAIHASYNYYYQTELVLADGLDFLTGVDLTWGQNNQDGSCVAGATCWTDANHDGLVQANELIGSPNLPSQFVNGVLTGTVPTVDPNLQIGRTREAVVGIDHQLAGNLHASVDYTHRYTDFGSAQYVIGTQPGAPNFPSSQNWVGPFNFTDPHTGITAPFFTLCAGCTTPQDNEITSTTNAYQTYNGVSLTLTKRLSNRWQGNVSFTWNDFRQFTPPGAFNTVTGSGSRLIGNPTGNSFVDGFTNNTPAYTVKGFGSYELPWYGLLASANWNLNDGNVRTEAIKGPGSIANCPPGTPSAQCTGGEISYGSCPRFELQRAVADRLPVH